MKIRTNKRRHSLASVALIAAVALLVSAGPAPAAVGQLENADAFDIAPDPDGLPHLVWTQEVAAPAASRLFYCRLEGVACRAGTRVEVLADAHNSPGRPHIVRQGSVLRVLWGVGAPSKVLRATSSTNGGTWTTESASSPSVPRLDDVVALDGMNLLAVSHPSADVLARQWPGSVAVPEATAVVGDAVGAGRVLAARAPDGRSVAAYAGSTDVAYNVLEDVAAPNASASWGPETTISGSNSGVALAGSAAGAWLAYTAGRGAATVLRYADGSFGAPVTLEDPQGPGAPTLFADDEGGVRYAWQTGNAVCVALSTDGFASTRVFRYAGLDATASELQVVAVRKEDPGRVVSRSGSRMDTLDGPEGSSGECSRRPDISLEPVAADATSATLTAPFDAKGQPAEVAFTVAGRTVAGRISGAAATAVADGLEPSTTYTAQARITTARGTGTSEERQFTTAAAPPPSTQQPEPDVSLGADADGDGADGDADLCPSTADREKAVFAGCGLEQLVTGGMLSATERTRADIRGVIGELNAAKTSRKYQAKATRLLRDSDRLARRAFRQFDDLDVCDASSSLARAASSARAAGAAAKAGVRKGTRAIGQRQAVDAIRHPERHGDADADARAQVLLHLDANGVAPLAADVRRVAGTMRTLCRRTRPVRTVRARALSLDGEGHVVLKGGVKVALATAAPGPLLGSKVTVKGPTIAGTLFAETVKAPPAKKSPGTPCLALKILSPSTGVLQLGPMSPEGFRTPDGRWMLEPWTGFTATAPPGGCPKVTTGKRTYQHYAMLRAGYRTKSGAEPFSQQKPIAAGEIFPDAIPDYYDDAHTFFLEVTHYRVACVSGFADCLPAEQVSPTTKQVIQRVFAPVGTGTVSKTSLSLGDGPPADAFGVVTVGKASSKAVPDSGVVAAARVPVGQGSSFPAYKPVRTGTEIAVHPGLDPLIKVQLHGRRNGHPYVYSADAPKIETDVVSICPQGGESFYELPWKPLDESARYQISQGPLGSFSHEGAYAWDVAMPEGTELRAARGGVVEGLAESYFRNWFKELEKKYPGKTEDDITEAQQKGLWGLAPNNWLAIRHRDGTRSITYHHPKDGVLVGKGDVVRRGQVVSKVGNVGYSTGPHLHFEVLTPGGNTLPITFRGARSRGGRDAVYDLVTCQSPDKDEWWASTNIQR